MEASPLPPLVLGGRSGRRTVTFPTAALLAPMEGITDPCFRGLVLDLGDAGGACTEFVRITTGPLRTAILAREVGEPRGGTPVGLQIMTPGPEHLPETAARAAAAGAAWVDLNFGCPVKRVFNKCAGSALLAHPERIGAIVAAAAGATDLPVSAKIRAGVDDASLLDEILLAAGEAGAAMITLHARLRRDAYTMAARWEWIARAAALVHGRFPGVALVGNGGIERAPDAARMMRETGCDGVMIGRAAFADPWIFREIRGGAPASPEEARAFALRYARALLAPGALRGGFGRVKQFVGKYRAGGLFDGREAERAALLRSGDPGAILARFGRADPAPSGTPVDTVEPVQGTAERPAAAPAPGAAPPPRPDPARRAGGRGGTGRTPLRTALLASLALHGALLAAAGGILLLRAGGEGARPSTLETAFEAALVLERDPVPEDPPPPEAAPPRSAPALLEAAPEPEPDPRVERDASLPVAVLPELAVTFEGAGRALPRAAPPARSPDGGPGPGVGESDTPAPAGEGEGFVPARPLREHCAAPSYPRRERERGVEGTLRVRLRVAADGSVEEVEVSDSSGSAALDRSAVDALSRWRFTPAEEGGLPVPSVVTFPVRFRLD